MLNTKRLVIASVIAALVVVAGVWVWTVNKPEADPTASFDARIERVVASPQSPMDPQVVASTVRARVERIITDAPGVVEPEGAVAALAAPLVSATLADPTHLLAFVRESSLRPNRTTEQIDAMRRHFRTVGVYGERPAGYESLSDEEWLDLVNATEFEDLTALYVQSRPRVVGWNWKDARVLVTAPGEEMPSLQNEMIALGRDIGMPMDNHILGGGPSFFTADASTLGDAPPLRMMYFIIPGVTEDGSRFIVGMVLGHSQGRWTPYSKIRIQARVPSDGADAAIPYSPVF